MRSLIIVAGWLIMLFNSCIGISPIPNSEAKKDIAYGPNSRNKMDVYLPNQRDSNTCMVMLIHGGAWVAGNKTDWTNDIITRFLQWGYAVSAINYRYADGNFHHQMQDVQMAVNYINDHTTDWKINKNKFAFVGGSAGGHLSLLFAHAFDSTQAAKAVVSLSGPTDMTDSVFHKYANNYLLGFVFPQFLGASYASDPQVYCDASPVFYHRNVPSFFINGSNDNLVPPAQGQRMYDSLRIYNIAADTTFFGNAGHDVFGTNGANKNQIFTEIKNWLQLYLH